MSIIIQDDEIVKSSSRGPTILELLETVQNNIERKECKLLGEELPKMILRCVSDPCGKKRTPLSQVWRNFHVHRISPTIKARWNSCISALHLSSDASKVSELTLQLILKRLMHAVVKQMVTPSLESKSTPSHVPLTEREDNVDRYVAGYVVMKLKKKYRLRSEYASVLDAIKTNIDSYESSIESLQDYTRVWVEQRDRGGLYHVNNDFFSLTKAIELVCRQYLDIRTEPIEIMLSKIEDDALKTDSVRSLWDNMAASISSSSQRVELLKSVIKLWSTIRIHSFAIAWTDLLNKGHRKGIRKTLKQCGTEKESM